VRCVNSIDYLVFCQSLCFVCSLAGHSVCLQVIFMVRMTLNPFPFDPLVFLGCFVNPYPKFCVFYFIIIVLSPLRDQLCSTPNEVLGIGVNRESCGRYPLKGFCGGCEFHLVVSCRIPVPITTLDYTPFRAANNDESPTAGASRVT